MSTIPLNFNYATAIGIQSLPGAIVFTVLYGLLLAIFFAKCFTHPTYVHYVLTFFCLSKLYIFQCVPFPFKFLELKHLFDWLVKYELLRLLYAPLWQVRKLRERRLDWLLQIRFFPVLDTFRFSIRPTLWSWIGESPFSRESNIQYLLFQNSTLLSSLRPASHPILRLTQNRIHFRLLLITGVILGIVAGSETGSSSVNPSQIMGLRISSVAIFLFLTLVQALQTVILATSSISGTQNRFNFSSLF